MDNDFNIKVCGLTRWEDMAALETAGVQYGGMIFYESSPRYAVGRMDAVKIKELKKIKKVGVFVNAGRDYILQQAKEYGLDLAQLHGDETPADCAELRAFLPVIKAFRLQKAGDLSRLKQYEACCDYFLFDTPGPLYGGNGQLFNWELLKGYTGQTRFFLSGGIGLDEAGQVKQFSHAAWYGVDVNSRFETAPGEKNMEKLKQFLCHLNFV